MIFAFLKIAFRNILRAKRRSLITVSAVGFGLGALIFIWAFVDGAHRQMVENYTSLIAGHIQIHKQGFSQKEQLEMNFSRPEEIIAKLTRLAQVKAVSPRIKAFGLVSSAEHSSIVSIMGIVPQKELSVSRMSDRVKEGKFLEDNKSIVIGERLAKNLNVSLGDKVVIMSQALDGSIASAAYHVNGLLDTGADEIDKGVALITYTAAQELFVMDNKASEIAVRINSAEDARIVSRMIANDLNSPDLEVLAWQDISPMLYQWVEFDNGFIWIIVLVVMIVVAIGILNTVLMGVLERTHEFGILLALGTKRRQVISMVAFESLILGIVGSIAGLGLGCVSSLYYGKAGINLSAFTQALNNFYMDAFIYPRLSFGHVATSLVLVLIISVVVSLYPAYHAANLKPVDAIRSI
ncbi:MAG: ABC transporter permease [Candidatus Omnitrophota bacterium]|nr:ABC transporter permease [Candidatus Omnitrophota bacterium]